MLLLRVLLLWLLVWLLLRLMTLPVSPSQLFVACSKGFALPRPPASVHWLRIAAFELCVCFSDSCGRSERVLRFCSSERSHVA